MKRVHLDADVDTSVTRRFARTTQQAFGPHVERGGLHPMDGDARGTLWRLGFAAMTAVALCAVVVLLLAG